MLVWVRVRVRARVRIHTWTQTDLIVKFFLFFEIQRHTKQLDFDVAIRSGDPVSVQRVYFRRIRHGLHLNMNM